MCVPAAVPRSLPRPGTTGKRCRAIAIEVTFAAVLVMVIAKTLRSTRRAASLLSK
jgi:hypothetical protein